MKSILHQLLIHILIICNVYNMEMEIVCCNGYQLALVNFFWFTLSWSLCLKISICSQFFKQIKKKKVCLKKC